MISENQLNTGTMCVVCMCVGSDISWSKLYTDVRASKCVPSVVVLSSFHQDEDLELEELKRREKAARRDNLLAWKW